jgi:hypothetical protein
MQFNKCCVKSLFFSLEKYYTFLKQIFMHKKTAIAYFNNLTITFYALVEVVYRV